MSCKQKQEDRPITPQEVIADSIPQEVPQVQETVKSSLARSLEDQGMVDIHTLDKSILVDLKYAVADNFTGVVLYDSLAQAYLHPVAAAKLVKAQQLLKDIDSGYTLLVYDAARPLSVQRKMYDVVRNTPQKAYVANPDRIGMHNFGMAVDLTICRIDGQPLDMGTPFDFFGKAAGINQEEQLKQQGLLTQEQIENRRLLRQVMTGAGFITIRGEWWHFNAVSQSEARRTARVIE